MQNKSPNNAALYMSDAFHSPPMKIYIQIELVPSLKSSVTLAPRALSLSLIILWRFVHV
jgi:hypothetical protein